MDEYCTTAYGYKSTVKFYNLVLLFTYTKWCFVGFYITAICHIVNLSYERLPVLLSSLWFYYYGWSILSL